MPSDKTRHGNEDNDGFSSMSDLNLFQESWCQRMFPFAAQCPPPLRSKELIVLFDDEVPQDLRSCSCSFVDTASYYGVVLTSRADTNCSGRSALFMSGMLVSSSYSAVAMLVSISEGLAREGLFGAILFRAC